MTNLDRKLDYIPAWDERNNNYAVSQLFGKGAELGRTYRYWPHGDILDQGSEGACVGFGWTAELLASPQRVKFHDSTRFAQEVYRQAQFIDQWPGENYEGTSVLAGAKVVRNFGLIAEYRWAFSTEEIIKTVLEVGPVVIGIPWYYSMYQTRPSGLVERLGQPGDFLVGGHCLTITGYSPRRYFWRDGFRRREVFRWVNSWGKSYGKRGAGYIEIEDFDRLFNEFGEACVPIGRVLPDNLV